MPTTTQQSISPIHPTLKTPRKEHCISTNNYTIDSETFSYPKYSQMDYQTFRPVTTSRQTNKQKTSNRSNFSDHNYNFLQKSKTTKPPNTSSQNQSQ